MNAIAANLAEVKAGIARAAARAGRRPDEIKLVAVTKNVEPPAIAAALAAGAAVVGENRVQDLVRKYDSIGNRAGWHLIGPLQTNKVRYILGKVDLIHSLDRWSLAAALEQRAARMGLVVDTLVEVNVAGEATKHGLAVAAVEEFLRAVGRLESVRVRGLMTVAPPAADPEAVRPVFRRLKQLAADMAAVPGVSMTELSMGMSGDFEVAIEEGATMVRIGAAIFGPRIL